MCSRARKSSCSESTSTKKKLGIKVAKDCWKVAKACQFFLAGPPCTPWSSSGKGLGEEDCRSQPLFGTLDYIIENKPALAVTEEVLGLLVTKKDSIHDDIHKRCAKSIDDLLAHIVKRCKSGNCSLCVAA